MNQSCEFDLCCWTLCDAGVEAFSLSLQGFGITLLLADKLGTCLVVFGCVYAYSVLAKLLWHKYATK